MTSSIGTKSRIFKASRVGYLKDFTGRIHLKNNAVVNAR